MIERAVRRALVLRDSTDDLSTADAARLARRSPKTVRRWITSGALRAQRRGRALVIRRPVLEAFLAGTEEGASSAAIASSLKKWSNKHR